MDAKPEFTIETANEFISKTVAQGSVDKEVQQDWRGAIEANFELTSDQLRFFRDLPQKSVDVVRAIIEAIGKGGGTLSLVRTESGEVANLVASNIASMKISPQWTICSFGVGITKCEWFPK